MSFRKYTYHIISAKKVFLGILGYDILLNWGRHLLSLCNLHSFYIRSRNSWLITVRKSQFGWSWHKDKHSSCANRSAGNDSGDQSESSKWSWWPMRWLCTAPEAGPGLGCWHCTVGEEERDNNQGYFISEPGMWSIKDPCRFLTTFNTKKTLFSGNFQEEWKASRGKFQQGLSDYLRPECTETSFLRPGLAGSHCTEGNQRHFASKLRVVTTDHPAASIMTLSIQVTWRYSGTLACITPQTQWQRVFWTDLSFNCHSLTDWGLANFKQLTF